MDDIDPAKIKDPEIRHAYEEAKKDAHVTMQDVIYAANSRRPAENLHVDCYELPSQYRPRHGVRPGKHDLLRRYRSSR